MEFQDKFIGFVDILGFKSLIEHAEAGEGMSLAEINKAVSQLGSESDRCTIQTHGPTICPMASRNSDDLDFQIAQASDCVIVSTEVSPSGAITLIFHCWGAVFGLLKYGLMCRGHIRRGNIYHKGQHFYGSGYQESIKLEKVVSAFKRHKDEQGTPFVEIDNSVSDYIRRSEDKCVREMFSRLVEESNDVCAIFPFKRLTQSVGGDFSPAEWRKHAQVIRKGILKLKDRLFLYVDKKNPKAIRKLEHYEIALDAQLDACDQMCEMAGFLNMTYPDNRKI